MWNILRSVGAAVLKPPPQMFLAHRGFSATMSSLCHTLCRTQTPGSFLVPKPVIFTQSAGFKVVGLLRERCKSCRRFMRDGRLYIKCMDFPKHNQMSMVKKHYNRWHLTHATQGKLRPY